MILTASLWPAVVTLVTGFINTVAIYYSSSRAIAFTIMVGTRVSGFGELRGIVRLDV